MYLRSPFRAPADRRTARSRRPSALLAASLGLAGALLMTSPAVAAPGDEAPTITGPATRTGWGTVTLTGTARPGAQVHLYESAFNWNDLQVSMDYDTNSIPVITEANTAGRFSFVRYVDTGFLFAARVDGVMSTTHLVNVQVVGTLTASSPAPDTVAVRVAADPNQPYLRIDIQRADTDGSWSVINSGYTDSAGVYATTLTGQGSGVLRSYRAFIHTDPVTGITSNTTVSRQVQLLGDSPQPPPPPPPPPAPKPPVTATGAIQFTRIQYDAPGRDTGSNTSLNGEWVRLTNKTKQTVNLKNWTVRDAAGHEYKITNSHSLAAGASVTVKTGRGTNGTPVATRYWGSRGHIWNNGGDTASLQDATGKTIDSCKWTKDANVTTC